MVTKEDLISVLKCDLKPALGCTEPIAIALASAYATKLIDEKIDKIAVTLSQNILKNAMGVGIPGTGERGIRLAAALGSVAGVPERELEVLIDVNEENIAKAKEFAEEERVSVDLADNGELFWIEVVVKSANHQAIAVIQGNHTNLILLKVDDNILQQNPKKAPCCKTDDIRRVMTIQDIFEIVKELDEEDLGFLNESLDKNYNIAKYGMEHRSGYHIGNVIMDNIAKGLIGDDMINYATALTAAGSDARMSGCLLPAMANSGSGNQGITLTVPLIAVAERLKKSHLELLRSVAMSHLISIHVKSYFGILSALCGVVNASIGVACGTVYLLGGSLLHIFAATQDVIGNISGMICDGAKLGCSLKVATGVRTAIHSAILGVDEVYVHCYEGINGKDPEESLANLGKIVLGGMKEVDRSILTVMLNKNNI
ncbi:MAG: hypothetical protein B6226_01225 [Candidatus Cloacimonetes bacterium 4572_65]|nr:MAG: hypothetical protein B6226_01225 [Candidatus Cloacimonetes bacterium 4572_65]